MTTAPTLFYLEDDEVLRANYTELLEQSGYRVTSFSAGHDLLERIPSETPDIFLLDLTIGTDTNAGFDVCKELRQRVVNEPIVFLTSHDSVIDEMVGLKLGADEYLRKDSPFELILVRLEALLRRKTSSLPAGAGSFLQSGPVKIDRTTSQAYFDDSPIDLPLTHVWILTDLIDHPGQVRSHRDLMRAANVVVEPNTIVAYIKGIRGVLQEFAPNLDPIRTERGRGYRWVAGL